MPGRLHPDPHHTSRQHRPDLRARATPAAVIDELDRTQQTTPSRIGTDNAPCLPHINRDHRSRRSRAPLIDITPPPGASGGPGASTPDPQGTNGSLLTPRRCLGRGLPVPRLIEYTYDNVRRMTVAFTPPGWPAQVRAPGAPDWERTAIAFLLDCSPPDFRAYRVLRNHPVVLARFAAQFVNGQSRSAEEGLAEVRTSLQRLRGPAGDRGGGRGLAGTGGAAGAHQAGRRTGRGGTPRGGVHARSCDRRPGSRVTGAVRRTP